MYDIIRDSLLIFTDVKLIQDSCYGAGVEAVNMALKYIYGYSDPWDFFDTFAYNFGLLYDSIFNAVGELYGGTVTKPNYFMVGYSIGNIAYLIFFTE